VSVELAIIDSLVIPFEPQTLEGHVMFCNSKWCGFSGLKNKKISRR